MHSNFSCRFFVCPFDVATAVPAAAAVSTFSLSLSINAQRRFAKAILARIQPNRMSACHQCKYDTQHSHAIVSNEMCLQLKTIYPKMYGDNVQYRFEIFECKSRAPRRTAMIETERERTKGILCLFICLLVLCI